MRINRDTSMTAMAHLTCAAHTRAELTDIVTRYRDSEVENILALGGDPPKELGLAPGELKHAIELVEPRRRRSATSRSVWRCTPSVIPRRPTAIEDRQRQAEKLAVADFGLSQFFFDADVWFEFLGDLDALGVTTPVIPGIMPVHEREVGEAHVGDGRRRVSRRARTAPARGRGRRRRDARGRRGSRDRAVPASSWPAACSSFHFYTLNRSTATREIYANLGLGPS